MSYKSYISIMIYLMYHLMLWFLFVGQGEEYKLFWPDQPEFVRMAAHFGATIVPFGVVGEDDIAEVSLAVLLFLLKSF